MWVKRSRSDPALARPDDHDAADPEARRPPAALATVREHDASTSDALPLVPQAALAAVQAAVCVGAVYLKSALATTPHLGSSAVKPGVRVFAPTVFAFYREACAAALLSTAAAIATGVHAPARRDVPAVVSAGLLLFLSQALYVHGIDRAGVAVAAALQPAIPVWTAALSVLLGKETASRRKVAGIALAAGGALCMVSGPSHAATHATHASATPASAPLLGKAALFANTLSMAAYYIVSKSLVARYPPLCVAGWAYVPAAAAMGAAAALTVPATAWPLPPSLRGPLAYWILVCSVFGYGATAWAARALPASHVAAFTCLQPFLGTALAAAFLGEPVSAWDAGALAVVAGLAIVARDGGGASAVTKRARRSPRPATPLAPPPGWWGKQWRGAVE